MKTPYKNKLKPAPSPQDNEHLLDRIKLDEQELLLIEDLLYVMMGIEGEIIVRKRTRKGVLIEPPAYVIDSALSKNKSNIDDKLTEMTMKLLPMSIWYQAIDKYIESHSSFEYGRVHHAFSAAMRGILMV